jgi:GNAT superfamily N-acetyltransferase
MRLFKSVQKPGEAAERVKKDVALKPLAAGDPEYKKLVSAYGEYLESMGVEYSVGVGGVLLAVYGGEEFEFVGASGRMRTLRDPTVVGHIISKKTDAVPAHVLADALQKRAKGMPPEELYRMLKELVPLNWNMVDSLPEAWSDEDASGFLSLVNVHPDFRRLGFSQMLVRGALRRFLDVDGLGYAFAFARAPGFPASGEPDIQKYVMKTDAAGLSPDVGIRIHQSSGQKVLCGVPKGAVDDESAGYSVLMASDLRELRARGRI